MPVRKTVNERPRKRTDRTTISLTKRVMAKAKEKAEKEHRGVLSAYVEKLIQDDLTKDHGPLDHPGSTRS